MCHLFKVLMMNKLKDGLIVLMYENERYAFDGVTIFLNVDFNFYIQIKFRNSPAHMADFVTVLTSIYPQDLYIIKGRLESEGIQCFLKDELTVQAYNLYSNAVGGVKLQVLEEDVEKARGILAELGYIKDEPVQIDLLARIEAKTRFIPILKNINVVNRIVILTILVVVLITTSVYFICRPSLFDLLTRNIWTVDKVYYNNKLVGPKSIDSVLSPSGEHYIVSKFGEFAEFRDNYYFSFPGIQSNEIRGQWKFEERSVITLSADTLKNILNGSYAVEISDHKLTLKSATTSIYAHSGF